jgi:perosamine synthetase
MGRPRVREGSRGEAVIPIYEPYLPPRSLRHAERALASGWISSRGKYPALVAERLAETLGVRHVLLVSSGTAATHLAVHALRFRHPEIETVYVPNNVYVAAWNSFHQLGHHRLLPVDADLATWNADTVALCARAAGARERVAFLIVHNLGNVVNVPALERAHPDHVFVEDCCEGLFGRYEGAFAGTRSLAASVSFFGNKIITSGEGGAVLTNDTEVYEYLDRLHDQGSTAEHYLHAFTGFNYRMTNVQAALLFGQLDLLPEILERKAHVFEWYRRRLHGHECIRPQAAAPATEHARWMFAVRVVGSPGFAVAEAYFRAHGIEIRPMFHPMSAHGHLREFAAFDERNARRLLHECVVLPSHPGLRPHEVDHVADTLLRYEREHRRPVARARAEPLSLDGGASSRCL